MVIALVAGNWDFRLELLKGLGYPGRSRNGEWIYGRERAEGGGKVGVMTSLERRSKNQAQAAQT